MALTLTQFHPTRGGGIVSELTGGHSSGSVRCGTGHVFVYAGTPPIPNGWRCACGKETFNSDPCAALRATLTQQAQEREALEKEVVSYQHVITANQTEFSKIERQLAAMTALRNSEHASLVSQMQAFTKLSFELEDMRKELAASQARCRELEEDWRLEVRLHGQTKATLAAREARMTILEQRPTAEAYDQCEAERDAAVRLSCQHAAFVRLVRKLQKPYLSCRTEEQRSRYAERADMCAAIIAVLQQGGKP